MNREKKIKSGKNHKQKKSKLHAKKGQEKVVTLRKTKRKQARVRGGNKKVILLNADTINLTIKGKTQKAEIKNVLETPQNKFLARQNRLMKGVIIETSEGKAKITNRPTQEGQINGVLIKE